MGTTAVMLPNPWIGRRACSVEQRSAAGGGQFGVRNRSSLIQISEQWQFDALVADIGDVNECARRQRLLDGEVPVLNVTPGHLLLHVENHIAGKIRRVSLPRGAEAILERISRAETADIQDAVGSGEARYERRVRSQHFRRRHAIPVVVSDSVAAANDGVLRQLISESDAGSKVVPIHFAQRTLFDRAVFGENKLAGRQIEVGEFVVRLVHRGRDLVADSEVQSEPIIHFPVVLDVEPIRPLPDVGDLLRRELVAAARTEVEIGQRVGDVGRARRQARVAAAIGIDSI